jgi:5-methylcytosine-specific restriction endonuclease McrA
MCVRTSGQYRRERNAANAAYDAKRANNPHRKLYQTKQWKKLRKLKLSINPVCEVCRQAPADTVHHKERASNNMDRFFTIASLQSACKRCHDTVCQQEESLGYSTQLGADGFPLDKRHPFYRGS